MGRVEIRKMALADRVAVEAVLSSAFAGITASGIVEREVALAPHTSLVAVDDGTIVGMACAVQYARLAYIGPMAVSAAHQGKGIGRTLFEALVQALESRGCLTMMLDATDAGEPLYRKFGFLDAARTFDLGRTAGPGVAVRPASGKLAESVTLDEGIFGANREPVFRRLLEVEGAALFSRPAGYLVAQTKLAGPFAALDREAAAQLLDEALLAGAVASRVLAPVENPHAEALLVSRGFRVQREVRHMRRGQPAGMRRDLMYGLASFAIG